jgi:hypothetical protein
VTIQKHVEGFEQVPAFLPGLALLDGKVLVVGGSGAAAREAGIPGAANESPPLSITGDRLTSPEGHRFTVKIDYLRTTFSLEKLDQLKAIGDHWFGQAVEMPYGAEWYRSGGHRWPDGGAQLVWSEESKQCMLTLPGKALDWLGAAEWRDIMTQLRLLGGKCTRLDLAADFWDRSLLDLEQVQAAADLGHFRGFRSCSVTKPMKRVAGEMVPEGFMVTFGRRGKDGKGAYYRFYDKGLESKGVHPSNRLECEFSADFARQLFETLAETVDDDAALARSIGRHLAGSIDFIDRTHSVDASRCPKLTWWVAVETLLTDKEKPIKLHAPRVIASIRKTAVWLRDGVAKSVALLCRISESIGYGVADVLEEIRAMGEIKLDAGRVLSRIDQTFDPAEFWHKLKRDDPGGTFNPMRVGGVIS